MEATSPTDMGVAYEVQRVTCVRGRLRNVIILVSVSLAAILTSCRYWPPVVFAPWTLRATANAEGHIALTWADAASEDGYSIYRRTNITGSWELLCRYVADATATLDVNVIGGTPYWYRVVAENTNGRSRFFDVTIVAPMVPPRNFWAVPYDNAPHVSLGWENVQDTEYVVLSRSADGVAFNWSVRLPRGTTYYDDLDAGHAPILHYRLQPCDALLAPVGPFATVTVKR